MLKALLVSLLKGTSSFSEPPGPLPVLQMWPLEVCQISPSSVWGGRPYREWVKTTARGPSCGQSVRCRQPGRGQRPRQVDAVPLESSVRPWHLLSSTLAPTELHLACCGSPLGSWGGDAPHILASGRCALYLQLKSKWDESIFTKGCIQALEGWLPRNIYIVAGVFIAISLLQVRSPALCGFLCPRGSHIFEPYHTWEDWWPHVELAGWWLPVGGGVARTLRIRETRSSPGRPGLGRRSWQPKQPLGRPPSPRGKRIIQLRRCGEEGARHSPWAADHPHAFLLHPAVVC